ncbi:unnamed protein product [Nippostrongylus brasiliensis]|uniref:Kelch-like protein 7 (inferred by orthology to a human protein) n=1 Tax=Nippostrongylus brasiliensis TaxID=27835 RepID=A0A0N4YGP9_NIPBR|nr:unnamed protein product [Nippostrongylus brasiliensis]
MQRRRFCLGVTVLNGTIFAVGGEDGSQISCEAEMLDPRQGEWISLPSMTNERFHFGLAAASGLLYAAGGRNGSQILNSVEVYDPRACHWATAQPMFKKRCHAGATVFRDQVVVVGGYDENKMDLLSAESAQNYPDKNITGHNYWQRWILSFILKYVIHLCYMQTLFKFVLLNACTALIAKRTLKLSAIISLHLSGRTAIFTSIFFNVSEKPDFLV